MLRCSWRALAGRAGLLQQGQQVSRVALSRCQSTADDLVEVCFVDPALVLEPAKLQEYKASSAAASILPCVCISLPASLLQELSRGQFSLGDRDDPESHWFFGQQGEMFQYKYAGSHVVQSGFSSAVAAEVLHRAERGEAAVAAGAGKPASFAEFAARVDSSDGRAAPAPFLFAGRVVDCASVGVYRLEQGGVEGVMLSSEYETAGAD